MVVKIYWILWAITLAATAFVIISGQSSYINLTVLGFVWFSLLYGGIISIIPTVVFHGEPKEH